MAWHVLPDQEEPWRRLLQELLDVRREQYTGSRRRLGILAESVWLVPKPSGGGVAVVYLEAEDPEWSLCELAASETPFDLWYGEIMRKLFGFDFAQLPQVAGVEILFDWRDSVSGERRGGLANDNLPTLTSTKESETEGR